MSFIGHMKGVFPTPDTCPFFPSDTDIQTKIKFSRHRQLELLARHLILSLTKSKLDITENFESPDTQTPLHRPCSWLTANTPDYSQTHKDPGLYFMCHGAFATLGKPSPNVNQTNTQADRHYQTYYVQPWQLIRRRDIKILMSVACWKVIRLKHRSQKGKFKDTSYT